jgi:hypothetical protein
MTADGFYVTTPNGQHLHIDRAAKLTMGCTVAVFLAGRFVLVGQKLRRPVPHRRLVIGCRDVLGNEGVMRIFGLRDEDTQIWRVTGVVTPI